MVELVALMGKPIVKKLFAIAKVTTEMPDTAVAPVCLLVHGEEQIFFGSIQRGEVHHIQFCHRVLFKEILNVDAALSIVPEISSVYISAAIRI